MAGGRDHQASSIRAGLDRLGGELRNMEMEQERATQQLLASVESATMSKRALEQQVKVIFLLLYFDRLSLIKTMI